MNEICSQLSSHWSGRWRGPQCWRSLTSPAQISTTRHFIRWNITLTKALAQTGWKQKEWELTGQSNEIFYLGESEIFSIYLSRFPSWPIWLKMWICTTGDHNFCLQIFDTVKYFQPLWRGGHHNVDKVLLQVWWGRPQDTQPEDVQTYRKGVSANFTSSVLALKNAPLHTWTCHTCAIISSKV